jgi:transposase
VISGVLRRLRTGAPWRDLPERYGPWKTVHERFRHWSVDGTGNRLPAHAQQHSDAVGAVDRTIVCVDSATVRVHQDAAGARKGGPGKTKPSAGRAAD